MSEVAATNEEQRLDLFPRGHLKPVEMIRLVLEVRPGERPLQPEFGCSIRDLGQEGLVVPQLVAGLMEEAIERWLPALQVQRVEVDSVTQEKVSARVWLGGRCESFTVRLRPLSPSVSRRETDEESSPSGEPEAAAERSEKDEPQGTSHVASSPSQKVDS